MNVSVAIANLFNSILVFIYLHFFKDRIHIFKAFVEDLQNNMGFSALCDGQECEHLCCDASI